MKTILIGDKYLPRLQTPLQNLGLAIIPVPDNPFVDEKLSGHADLSVFYDGSSVIFLSPHLKGSALEEGIRNWGLNVILPDIIQDNLYPNDAQMNICLIEKTAFLNSKTAAQPIVDYLVNTGVTIYNVNQGYTKCSTCVISGKSLITSDRGVALAAENAGFDCLMIEPGFINLEGFEYGFIGGTSFLIDVGTVAFTGRLDEHPDRDRILAFIIKHGLKPVFLTDIPAFDIGSAIIL